MKSLFAMPTLAVALAAAASAQTTQFRVPVGGMGQHIVARSYTGVDCANGSPTGKGTAALYFPFIAGIPEEYLFSSKTVQDETTALITGVFSNVELSGNKNGDMSNTFLKAHEISYYYHPDSSPKSWTDFDGFKKGELIATYQVSKNMFSQIGDASLVINSGPFILSKDFTLPSGKRVNLRDFMPNGITVHIFGSFKLVSEASGRPAVINVSQLGTCAVMSPFSGSGTHPGPNNRRIDEQ